MRRFIVAMICGLLAGPAIGEGEFAEGSQVAGWKNLQGRENAVFKAKVVDIVCELSGDCPADCGAGSRQLGLLREADGRLLLAAKNAQAQFNGAAEDLKAFCGQTVFVDGLLVANPALTATKVYQVHFIRPEDSDKWTKAARWTQAWKDKYPEFAEKKGPWFRHDPEVQADIEARGYLGLGPEVDKKFIEEFY